MGYRMRRFLNGFRGSILRPGQFRLRELLLATTGLALLLGFLVWANQYVRAFELPGLVICAGIALSFCGLGTARVVRVFQSRRWPRTEGRIARYWILPGTDEHGVPNDSCLPVFVFSDRSGRRVVAISPALADPERWPRGTSVEVCYDPRHPQHAELTALLRPSLWRAAGAFLVGGFFGGFAVAILRLGCEC